MAIDSYMIFTKYDNTSIKAESQVILGECAEELAKPFKAAAGRIFEVESYNFDVEQTLSIGSQSSGAGAGKITFNPFGISRKIDVASPEFFKMACNGTAFKTVQLGLRKSAGTDQSGVFYLRFDFKLVAVKTLGWEHDDEAPKENVTFEYGGLQIRYCQQEPSGKLMGVTATGWNRVKNIADVSDAAIE